MKRKIKVGISACLLGQRVRYDGSHKLDPYIRDTLGGRFEFIPVCPEVGCGLPVPREPMQLTGDPDSPRLVTISTGIDLTERMLEWIRRRIEELGNEDLRGFILKSRSPSCGMDGVMVFGPDGQPACSGAGLFARALTARFPTMPLADEERLRDMEFRERFIRRVSASA